MKAKQEKIEETGFSTAGHRGSMEVDKGTDNREERAEAKGRKLAGEQQHSRKETDTLGWDSAKRAQKKNKFPAARKKKKKKKKNEARYFGCCCCWPDR